MQAIHYYMANYRDIDGDAWNRIYRSIIQLIENLSSYATLEYGINDSDGNTLDRLNTAKVLTFESDDLDPEFNTEMIWFEGYSEGCENPAMFVVPRKNETNFPIDFHEHPFWDFDLLVCASLIVIEHEAPGARSIKSSGNPDAWMNALDFVRRVVDPKAVLPPSVDPDRTVTVDTPTNPLRPPLEVFRSDATNTPASLYI